MRRWLIVDALVANALAGGLVLLLLWSNGGWGEPARLSAAEARLLLAVVLVAFALNLLLAPVLGLSFWARDRGTRHLETRLAASEAQRHDEPPGEGRASRLPAHWQADHQPDGPAEGAGSPSSA